MIFYIFNDEFSVSGLLTKSNNAKSLLDILNSMITDNMLINFLVDRNLPRDLINKIIEIKFGKTTFYNEYSEIKNIIIEESGGNEFCCIVNSNCPWVDLELVRSGITRLEQSGKSRVKFIGFPLGINPLIIKKSYLEDTDIHNSLFDHFDNVPPQEQAIISYPKNLPKIVQNLSLSNSSNISYLQRLTDNQIKKLPDLIRVLFDIQSAELDLIYSKPKINKKSKINVLIPIGYPNFHSGADTSLSNLLSALHLTESEFNPILLSPFQGSFTDYWKKQGFEILLHTTHIDSSNLRMSRINYEATSLNHLIKEKNIDLIYGNSAMAGQIAAISSVYSNIHYIGRVITEESYRNYNYSNIWMADLILTCSNYIKNLLISLGYSKDKIKVVHEGLSTEWFSNTNEKKKNKDEITFGIVARLDGIEKNVLQGINIFKRISLLNKDKNLKLKIYGKAKINNSNFTKDLVHYIRSAHNIDDEIEFCGFSNTMIDEYDKLDLLIHPALKEAYGMVILESLSRATPVIAFNIGGNSEQIIDGVTGYLANNEDEFVDKINLLINDITLLESMSKNASAHAKEHFCSSHFVENTLNHWRSILNLK